MGHDGVNWVKELTECQRVLNDNTKEVLGYMTPFHDFLERKLNFIEKTTECL